MSGSSPATAPITSDPARSLATMSMRPEGPAFREESRTHRSASTREGSVRMRAFKRSGSPARLRSMCVEIAPSTLTTERETRSEDRSDPYGRERRRLSGGLTSMRTAAPLFGNRRRTRPSFRSATRPPPGPATSKTVLIVGDPLPTSQAFANVSDCILGHGIDRLVRSSPIPRSVATRAPVLDPCGALR